MSEKDVGDLKVAEPKTGDIVNCTGVYDMLRVLEIAPGGLDRLALVHDLDGSFPRLVEVKCLSLAPDSQRKDLAERLKKQLSALET